MQRYRLFHFTCRLYKQAAVPPGLSRGISKVKKPLVDKIRITKQPPSFTSPPSSRVWFQLLDSATGQPFEGTTTDFVSLSSTADVDDFRDAVKAEYHQPKYLQNIPSGALLVYKDKDAFEKRNATVGKVEPLEEDSLISGLGASKRKALIVAVPVESSFDLDSYVHQYLDSISSRIARASSLTDRLNRRCLTFNLTQPWSDLLLNGRNIDDCGNNVKLLIGVSGAGKTRKVLELLSKNFGYYFAAVIDTEIGSRDLSYCMQLSHEQPLKSQRFIQLVRDIRIVVIDWLVQKGYATTPFDVLIAQLYPREIFGVDIYLELFKQSAYKSLRVSASVQHRFNICIIDEIQSTLSKKRNFDGFPPEKERYFLSPLVRDMKQTFKCFILSGTGINYSAISQAASSLVGGKPDSIYNVEELDNFKIMEERDILDFSKTLLASTGIPDQMAVEMAEAISKLEYLYGRPRLCAGLIDKIMSKIREGDFNIDIGGLYSVRVTELLDPDSSGFCLRSVIHHDDWRDIKVDGLTIYQLLLDAFVNFVSLGHWQARLNSEQSLVKLIEMGIGYRDKSRDNNTFLVRLCEPIVCLAIPQIIPLEDLVFRVLTAETGKSPAGYWFEHIIALACLKNYGPPDLSPSHVVVQYNLLEYLINPRTNTVCLPENAAGPDVLYFDGKIMHIIQAKYRKALTTKEQNDACKTTDYKKFYTVKTTGAVLKGYEQSWNKVQAVLQKYKIERILVAHTEAEFSLTDLTEVKLISPTNDTLNFFEKIVPTDVKNADPNSAKNFVWNTLSRYSPDVRQRSSKD